jgi:hypothetical protein
VCVGGGSDEQYKKTIFGVMFIPFSYRKSNFYIGQCVRYEQFVQQHAAKLVRCKGKFNKSLFDT